MVSIWIKTQGIYDALYNFKDDTVGGNPTDWSTYEAQGTIQVIDNHNGHKRVIELHDTVNSGATNPLLCSNNFDGSQGNGTIELYLETDDVTKYTLIRVQTVCFDIYIDNSKWQYNAVGNIPAFDGVCDPVNDTVYHLKIHFRANGGAYQGLNNYEFKVILDGTFDSGALAFANNNVPNALLLASGQTDSDYYSWWDAIDYSWASGYSEGRNLLLEEHTDITEYVPEWEFFHEARSIPKIGAILFLRSDLFTIEYDDIVRIRGVYESYFNANLHGYGEIQQGSEVWRDETLGVIPTGWTDSSGGTCSAILIDKFNEIGYPIQLYDDDGNQAQCWDDFDSNQTYGTIEFVIATTDCTLETLVEIEDDANNVVIQVRIDADQFSYHDGVAGWQNLFVPSDCKGYIVRLDFECTAGGYLSLAQYEYDIEVFDLDGVSQGSASGIDFTADQGNVRYLYVSTQAADQNYLSFIAGVGYTWGTKADGTAYSRGDNQSLEVAVDDQILFEGKIIDKDTAKIQRVRLVDLGIELKNISPGEEGAAYAPNGFAFVANYSEEVLAEIINDKCSHVTATSYTETYRGIYNCMNDSNGATPYGVLDLSGANCSVTVNTGSLGNISNYMDIFDNDAVAQCYVYFYFGSQGYGTIEFWVRYTNIGNIANFFFKDAAGNRAFLYGLNANQHSYYNGAWTNVVAAANNTWYRIRLDYESTTGGYLGLAQYTFNLYIYNTANTELGSDTNVAFENNVDPIYLDIETSGGGNNYHIYLHAIGYSFNSFYTVGDNTHIHIDKFEVGSLTTDKSLQGEYSVKKLADDIATLETFTWCLTPTHELIFTEGTIDSHADLSATDTWDIEGLDRVERINKVWLKCGFDAVPNRVYGTADDLNSQATYGIKLLKDFYTHITVQAEADNTAQSIIDFEAGVPKLLEAWHRQSNDAYIQILQTMTITASTLYYDRNDVYVDADEWLLTYERVEGRMSYYNKSDLDLVDSLIFEIDKEDAEALEFLINQ